MARRSLKPRRVAKGVVVDAAGVLRIRIRGEDCYGERFDSLRIATAQAGRGLPLSDAITLARAECIQARRERAKGIKVDPSRTVWELAEIQNHLSTARNSTKRQWLTRSHHWRAAFGDLLPYMVSPDRVKEWYGELLTRGLAPGYVNGIVKDVRGVFRTFALDGVIDRNPFEVARLKAVKDKRASRSHKLDGSKLAPVFAAWRETDLRAWTAFTILLATGMRPQELLGSQRGQDVGPLTWAHLSDGAIWLDEDRCKNGTQRPVPISPFVAEVLAFWRLSTGAAETDSIVELGRDALANRWGHGLTRAGLTAGRDSDGTLYDLRGIARSVMSRAQVADVVADQILGHKTRRGETAIKKAYDKPWPGEVEEAARILGEFARGCVGWPRFDGEAEPEMTSRTGYDGEHGATKSL